MCETKLPRLFNNIKQQVEESLRDDLKHVSTISVKLLLFTDDSRNTFLSIFLSYIDINWQPESFLLSCNQITGADTSNITRLFEATLGGEEQSDFSQITNPLPNIARNNSNKHFVECFQRNLYF